MKRVDHSNDDSNPLSMWQVLGAWLKTYVGAGTILGAMLLLLGALATSSGESGNVAIGTVLVGLGSIVFSSDAYQAIGRQRESERIRSQIQSSTRQVVELSNHLFDAVENAALVDGQTTISLVGQVADQLAGLSYELEQASGSTLPVEIINKQRERNRELDRRKRLVIEQQEAGEITPEQAKMELASIREKRDAVPEQPPMSRVRVREETPCPNCGTATEVRLGENRGDSATGNCPNPSCNLRFHAHRSGSGGIFTRLWGSGSPAVVPTAAVTCPSCEASIQYHVRPGDSIIERYCFECKNRVFIDVDAEKAIRSEESKPQEGRFLVEHGRAVITCLGCSETLPRIWSDGDTHLRPCITCRALVVAFSDPNHSA